MSERQIQRDLHDLEECGYAVCKEGKPQTWWIEPSKAETLRPTDTREALSLSIIGMFDQLLPPDASDLMRERVQKARKTLELRRSVHVEARWSEKIVVLSAGFALQPPKIDPKILQTIQRALHLERRVSVLYESRERCRNQFLEKSKGKILPRMKLQRSLLEVRGLLVKSELVYAVCTLKGRPDSKLRWYRVDRMRSAIETEEPNEPMPEFNLKQYVAAGNSEFGPSPEPQEFEAWVSDELAATLDETPLSASPQELVPLKGGGFILRTRVSLGWHLQNFLASRGEHLRVRKPKDIALLIEQRLRQAVELYG